MFFNNAEVSCRGGLEVLGVPAVSLEVIVCIEVQIGAPLLLATYKYKVAMVISPQQQWEKRSGPNLRFSAHSMVCGGCVYSIYRRKVCTIL